MARKKRKRGAEAGDVATNRRARQRFEFVEQMEAGIQLQGSEVKSLREGKAQLADAYAVVERGEVWLRNLHISPYAPASYQNHDPERPRKLLLHRHQIERLIGKTQQRGLTLIPTRIYLKGRNAKVELALARGRRKGDHRHAMAERDAQREAARALGRQRKGMVD